MLFDKYKKNFFIWFQNLLFPYVIWDIDRQIKDNFIAYGPHYNKMGGHNIKNNKN